MLLHRPLSVVTPTVDGDVLAVLARADRGFTVGEVHQLIGEHSINGVRKALARLAEQGIVLSTPVANANIYRLNTDHLAASAVIELATLRSRLLERLRSSFDAWEQQPVYAALFGSSARGNMRVDSDLDIFVVRAADRADDDQANLAWEHDSRRLAADATSWTGNDARLLEMSDEEVRVGLADSEAVLADIQSVGILLHGHRNFWRKVTHG